MKRRTSLIQGFYYLALGFWPLLHEASYRNCYGNTNDSQLNSLVGLLLICSAICLIVRRYSFLGFCIALSFVYIDVIYLLDKGFVFFFPVDITVQSSFALLICYEAYNRCRLRMNKRPPVNVRGAVVVEKRSVPELAPISAKQSSIE